MTCRLQGRQGDGPSGTTSKPGDTEVPVTTPGESPAPGTAWPKTLEVTEPMGRREWEAQYLQQPLVGQIHFAFLWQRPKDKEPWAVIYSDRQRAENCEFRVSKVQEVRLERFFPEHKS